MVTVPHNLHHRSNFPLVSTGVAKFATPTIRCNGGGKFPAPSRCAKFSHTIHPVTVGGDGGGKSPPPSDLGFYPPTPCRCVLTAVPI